MERKDYNRNLSAKLDRYYTGLTKRNPITYSYYLFVNLFAEFFALTWQ